MFRVWWSDRQSYWIKIFKSRASSIQLLTSDIGTRARNQMQTPFIDERIACVSINHSLICNEYHKKWKIQFVVLPKNRCWSNANLSTAVERFVGICSDEARKQIEKSIIIHISDVFFYSLPSHYFNQTTLFYFFVALCVRFALTLDWVLFQLCFAASDAI